MINKNALVLFSFQVVLVLLAAFGGCLGAPAPPAYGSNVRIAAGPANLVRQEVVNNPSSSFPTPLTQVRVIPVEAIPSLPEFPVTALRGASLPASTLIRAGPELIHHRQHHLEEVPSFAPAPVRILPDRGFEAPGLVRIAAPEPAVLRHGDLFEAPGLVRIAAAPGEPTVLSRQPEAEAQYSFSYNVADPVTGDVKSREETRDGNVVSGSYSVADPDGRQRLVTYTADALNGFRAQVTYDGLEGPPSIPIESGSTGAQGLGFVGSGANDAQVISVSRQVPNLENVRLLPSRTAAAATLGVQHVAIGSPVQRFTTVPISVLGQDSSLLPEHIVTDLDAANAIQGSQLIDEGSAIDQTGSVVQLRTTNTGLTAKTKADVNHAAVTRVSLGGTGLDGFRTPTTATVVRSSTPTVLRFKTPQGVREIPIISYQSGY